MRWPIALPQSLLVKYTGGLDVYVCMSMSSMSMCWIRVDLGKQLAASHRWRCSRQILGSLRRSRSHDDLVVL